MNKDALREVLREIALVAAAETHVPMCKTKVFLACNIDLGNVVYVLVPSSAWGVAMRYDWHGWLAECTVNKLVGIELVLCLPVKDQQFTGSFEGNYIEDARERGAFPPDFKQLQRFAPRSQVERTNYVNLLAGLFTQQEGVHIDVSESMGKVVALINWRTWEKTVNWGSKKFLSVVEEPAFENSNILLDSTFTIKTSKSSKLLWRLERAEFPSKKHPATMTSWMEALVARPKMLKNKRIFTLTNIIEAGGEISYEELHEVLERTHIGQAKTFHKGATKYAGWVLIESTSPLGSMGTNVSPAVRNKLKTLLNYYNRKVCAAAGPLPAQAVAALHVQDIPSDLMLDKLVLWVSSTEENRVDVIHKTPFTESVINLVAEDLAVPSEEVEAVVDVLPQFWCGTVGDLVGAVRAALL